MGETWGVIHHETKFLSTHEPMEPDKLCASKIQWWNKHRIDIPILKGAIRGKKMVTGSKQVQNLGRQILSDFKARE